MMAMRENDASCRNMQEADGSKKRSEETGRRLMMSRSKEEEQFLAVPAGINPTLEPRPRQLCAQPPASIELRSTQRFRKVASTKVSIRKV